jgi:GT2 family glycosyltransferase
LLWELLKTRARTGDPQSIVEALRPWMGFLLQHARVPAAQIALLGEKPADLALYRLPATFVDSTPFNVLETNNGLFAIDLEWTSDSEVSLGWVVARGVLHSLLAGVPSANSLNSNAEIANALCSEFGLSVSEQELEAWMEREGHFQTAVMGAETTTPTIKMISGGLRTWLSEITRLNQVVAERDDLLTSVYNTLGASDKQVAEVYQVLASRDEEVASLGHTIRAQEQETVRIGEQLQHAQEEIGRAQAEIGRRTEEVGRAHEELGHAQEELGGLLKQLSIVRTQLGAIEASTSWKITKVFRDALSPYPGLRRAIKRTSRIVYWTATLQLPQRLKARRRLLKDRDQIAASPLFDAAWYLREYSDVASAGLDPALHYLLFGAAERRNPGPSFDAAWYLDHNADLAAARVNPLLHYLQYGRSEGRQSRAVASAETKETPEEGLESPESASAKSAMSALLVVRLNTLLSGTAILKLPVSDTPDISIILVLHNRAELTLACLASIRECLGASEIGIQVVIFDNGSTDLTSDLLARVEGANIIRNSENLHFLRGVNRAAAEAIGRHILLLNNDAQLLPGSLEAALRTLESATDIGAVGGRIILPDGTLQEAGSIIWSDGSCLGYARGRKPDDPEVMFRRDVDFCSGAFLLTRRELFERLDGFDEDFAPAYYEEVDYCVRLWQAGFRVVYDPGVVILHYEFASSSSSTEALLLQRTNRRLFCDKHSDWLRERRAPRQCRRKSPLRLEQNTPLPAG